MKSTFAALFFFVSLAAFSQDTHCNCLENLNKTIEKTTENYAGYPVKVNPGTQSAYHRLLEELRQKAATESQAKACYFLIKRYIDFFQDKHFILTYANERDYDSTVVSYQPDIWKKKKLADVEGLWVSADGQSKVAIQKAKDGTFQALKVESPDDFPVGFVYFTLTPDRGEYTVKLYDSFISTQTPAKQIGNLLRLWNHALWGKVYPRQMTPAEQAELATWKDNNHGLAFRKLADDVSYLKIPTFQNNDAAIQQLVAANDSTIRATNYLVVDLTGNLGGNTGWVFFLPYFMSNPVVQYPSMLRVTPENVQMKLADIEPFVKNPIPEEYKKYFPEEVLNQYIKAYEELPATTETFYPVPGVTFPLDSVTANPKKIALIVDNFTGSSAEYFFFLSKQSKKTLTYGRNTLGMMDYEGMSYPTPLPYDKFYLTIPIVKSSWTDRQPIDATGFEPEVLLKSPQSEWLKEIVDDLRKR